MRTKFLLCLFLFLTLSRTAFSQEDTADQTSSAVSDAVHTSEKHQTGLSGFISFVSDYRFRGISQTFREPAVQGSIEYTHSSGLYLETFGTNVDGTTHLLNNTSMEWDFIGGYKGKLFPLICQLSNFHYNFGFIYYYFPGGRSHEKHSVSYDTLEYYVELAYKQFNIKCSQTLTNFVGLCSKEPPYNWHKDRPAKPNGSTRGSLYLEANYTIDFWKKWQFVAHVGYQFFTNYSFINYCDWRATLSYEFKWFNIFATYIGTNANKNYFDIPDNQYHPRKKSLGAQGAVFGIVKTF